MKKKIASVLVAIGFLTAPQAWADATTQLSLSPRLAVLASLPQYVDEPCASLVLEPCSLPNVFDTGQRNSHLLAQRIAARYSVPLNVAEDVVQTAHEEARAQHMDPLLVLSVIAAESSFNPAAKNKSGAVGLMQTIPRWHGDKMKNLGVSSSQLTSIKPNVRLGVEILKEYLKLSGGNLPLALQKYNGSAGNRSQRYSNKIMRHYDWLFHQAM